MSRRTVRWFGIVGTIASVIGVALYFLPPDRSSAPSQNVHVPGSEGIGVIAGRDVTVTVNPEQPEKQPAPLLGSDEIEKIQAQGFYYAAEMREQPMAAGMYETELKTTAERLGVDLRYAEQAPHQTALIYRLYAATLLLSRPSGDNIRNAAHHLMTIQTALPWLRKAIELDERVKDYEELKAAEQVFTEIANGDVSNIDARSMLRHQFRVAMAEAKAEDVEAQVEEALKLQMILAAPRSASGSSAKEDFEYFTAYPVGSF